MCFSLGTGKEQAAYREEARDLMRQVQEKCHDSDPDRKVCCSATYALHTLIPDTALDHCRIHRGRYHR